MNKYKKNIINRIIMDVFVEKYVNFVINDIVGIGVKSELNCYVCNNKRAHPSIYCKKHENDLGGYLRMKMIRKNNRNFVIDANGELFENNGKFVNNLKKTVNIDLYKKEMAQTGGKTTKKTKTKSAPKSKKVKAKVSRRSKSSKKGGAPVSEPAPVETPAPSKGGSGKSTNPWMVHVRAFRAEHPELSYKECLVGAKATYNK